MNPSNVVKNLWIGPYPELGEDLFFDRVILSAKEFQPRDNFFPGTRIFPVPLSDENPRLSLEESALALQAGAVVSWWMRQGKKVLITSGDGLNRSAIIAAIALVTGGMPSEVAIKKVREARGPKALSNPHLVRLLQRVADANELRIAV